MDDQEAVPEFPTGHTVLALYPSTTCFYKAIVVCPPSKVQNIHPVYGVISLLLSRFLTCILFALLSSIGHWSLNAFVHHQIRRRRGQREDSPSQDGSGYAKAEVKLISGQVLNRAAKIWPGGAGGSGKRSHTNNFRLSLPLSFLSFASFSKQQEKTIMILACMITRTIFIIFTVDSFIKWAIFSHSLGRNCTHESTKSMYF